MRLVVDTNILISALLVSASLPAHLLVLWRQGQFVVLWRQGQFDLLTSADQIDEMTRVTRYPKLRERLVPTLAGRLINELRDLAVMVTDLPIVTICTDPYDNYLLAIAQAGSGDFLVTGDKRDLLGLKVHAGARILTVRDFLTMQGRLP